MSFWFYLYPCHFRGLQNGQKQNETLVQALYPCHFRGFQNTFIWFPKLQRTLHLCYFRGFQNKSSGASDWFSVLYPCHFRGFQNSLDSETCHHFALYPCHFRGFQNLKPVFETHYTEILVSKSIYLYDDNCLIFQMILTFRRQSEPPLMSNHISGCCFMAQQTKPYEHLNRNNCRIPVCSCGSIRFRLSHKCNNSRNQSRSRYLHVRFRRVYSSTCSQNNWSKSVHSN